MGNKQSSKSQIVRLHYFGINARASSIRAILHYKKVKFEDKRYDFESWGGLKKSGEFEFEQIPMLEIGGKKLVQSIPICLYLSRVHKLLGSTLYEEYLITSLLSHFEDLFQKLIPVLFPRTDEQKANIEKNTQELFNVTLPFFLKRFEKRLIENGKAYMVGDKFSLADIFSCVTLYSLFRNPNRRAQWEPIFIENAPNLNKLVDRIHQNELAGYFAQGYIAEGIF